MSNNWRDSMENEGYDFVLFESDFDLYLFTRFLWIIFDQHLLDVLDRLFESNCDLNLWDVVHRLFESDYLLKYLYCVVSRLRWVRWNVEMNTWTARLLLCPRIPPHKQQTNEQRSYTHLMLVPTVSKAYCLFGLNVHEDFTFILVLSSK